LRARQVCDYNFSEMPMGSRLTQKRVLRVDSGSSVSIKFKSWENRFVITPVSVVVKKCNGARISVCRAS
jgi:hypothetical protein